MQNKSDGEVCLSACACVLCVAIEHVSAIALVAGNKMGCSYIIFQYKGPVDIIFICTICSYARCYRYTLYYVM